MKSLKANEIKVRAYLFILVMFNSFSMNSQDINKDIHRISNSDSIEEIESIIKNTPEVLSYKQFDNRNILFTIENSKLDVFSVLLKNGADPNEKDDAGWTPLTYNTSNYELFKLFREYGGDVIINDNHFTDYISLLVNDYTSGNQDKTIKILETVSMDAKQDLNKVYNNGLTLSHMLIINYLTYSDDTNFDQLINLLISHGMTFKNKVSKHINLGDNLYKISAGDSCIDIVKKVHVHEYYNGRDINYIKEKCGN